MSIFFFWKDFRFVLKNSFQVVWCFFEGEFVFFNDCLKGFWLEFVLYVAFYGLLNRVFFTFVVLF